jgi:hypothetical protein
MQLGLPSSSDPSSGYCHRPGQPETPDPDQRQDFLGSIRRPDLAPILPQVAHPVRRALVWHSHPFCPNRQLGLGLSFRRWGIALAELRVPRCCPRTKDVPLYAGARQPNWRR